ncbi:MAG TPA: glycoside hydrolase family 2 TIM barrel-domain containing protein [Pedococcus sp.]|nr:glycoside hydrolase family 2 TIM barrel-domain containing protein [Pedococcus sp.]
MTATTASPGVRRAARAVRLDRWTVRADGRAPREVVVPGPAVELGWADWHESTWETVWTWTTTAELDTVPACADLEVCAVLGRITVRVNGIEVGSEESGFLPCTFDVVSALRPGTNTVEIVEDARWRPVPPMGSPLGASDVDFFLPAGIHRPVVLRLSDDATLRGVTVRSSDLLTHHPVVAVTVPVPPGAPRGAVVTARLLGHRDGWLVAETRCPLVDGEDHVSLSLRPGPALRLWSPEDPVLHRVETRVEADGEVLATGVLRTGFREVSWGRDGLHLNGTARRVLGLNRHELFPFVGFAASDRAQRNDARILKEDLGLDLVRCCHYPQSEAFLDACDELGLLVFEEAPGWQYAGTAQRDPVYDDPWQPVPEQDRDASFERHHVEQFRRMVERDRHRPSVVLWGAFINETRAFTPDLWDEVIAEGRALDPERALSGATRYRRDGHEAGSFDSAHDAQGRRVWPFDVFGFNDYRLGADDRPDFLEPVPDYPYLVTEAIGQMPRFREWFTRGDRAAGLSRQALYHADAIEFAYADDVLGVIGWAAFDYPSPCGSLWGSDEPALGRRGHALKTPGVADIFRIPKPAAALYRAQRSPEAKVVLEPAFAWDALASDTEPLAFASNCEELLVSVDGGEPTHLLPDRARYPLTPHPLFVLPRPAADAVELHVRGRIGDRDVAELTLTRDTSRDRLEAHADDARILGDGVDSTRVAFQVSDAFGNLRATAAGPVSIRVEGPGQLVGPDVMDLPASAGAVWVRSLPGAFGTIRLHLSHPTAGLDRVAIDVRPAH